MALSKKSPLLSALLAAGREALEGDLKERLDELRTTPMGHMIDAAMKRKAQLEAEGKPATEEDVRAWIEECRRIAREEGK